MPQDLIVGVHPPDLCPSANEKIRNLAAEGGKEMPALGEKLGVKILATYVPMTNHQVFVAVEADDANAVREFAFQGRWGSGTLSRSCKHRRWRKPSLASRNWRRSTKTSRERAVPHLTVRSPHRGGGRDGARGTDTGRAVGRNAGAAEPGADPPARARLLGLEGPGASAASTDKTPSTTPSASSIRRRSSPVTGRQLDPPDQGNTLSVRRS
jgi:hypothetical protein